jgi:hypothetical protein
MTEKQARTAANTILAAAALGAAFLVVRSPKLRRMAWQMARQYATGPLAAWAALSVREAWDESASSARPLTARATADSSAPGLPPARAAADRTF